MYDYLANEVLEMIKMERRHAQNHIGSFNNECH